MTDPYGTWDSPLDTATVAGDSLDFGHMELYEDTPYWLERRPTEGGRGVVLQARNQPTPLTPDDHDVRSLVHEYGGADFGVVDGDVVYTRFDDQRLYRTTGDDDATPLTPEPPTERSHRYADIEVDPQRDRLYCVRERHAGPGTDDEPVNELVTLPATGGEPAIVASGSDFYSFPRLSPDGQTLAWTTWNHPQMPWDGTVLNVASVDADGHLRDTRELMGGPTESVFQPDWSPTGDLYAVSDRSGWWNIYTVPVNGGDPTRIRGEAAEYGGPQWNFGVSTYGFRPDGTILAIRQSGTEFDLLELGPSGDHIASYDLPFGAISHPRFRVGDETLLAELGGPTQPLSITQWSPGEEPTIHRQASELGIPETYISTPEPITYPTGSDGDELAHALYYPPKNPTASPPPDERPPVVTVVHGGPTSHTLPIYSQDKQFFTTRGIAVVDVNYRGSTGYGREYRERLDGEWGVVDVEDCVAAATYLVERGDVDADRLAIRGGSAGGYATLAALAFHDTFDAGASYYGVADLRSLAHHTHKFESRYLDSLVGPLPEAEDVYIARSPAEHAADIDAPLLVLQGGQDQVVPPDQAEDIVEPVAATGTPYAYIEFPSERHGFRTQAARERALAAELGFYATVFDFEPSGVDPLTLTEGTVEKEVVETDA